MPTAAQNLVHGTPHPHLGPAVAGYLGCGTFWSGRASWQLLPRGFVVLLLDLDRCGALVAGLHDHAIRCTRSGRYRGIAVGLRPTAAFAMLGVDLSCLGHQWCVFADQLGSVVRDLLGRLSDAVDWPTRFALLDQFLLAAPPTPIDLAELAWQRLCEAHGALTALATQLSVSTRTLETHFRRQIGVSPKNAARILRFHHAVRLLDRPNADLARVAHDCGFTDHAHFAKEVRAMTGYTPPNSAPASGSSDFYKSNPTRGR